MNKGSMQKGRPMQFGVLTCNMDNIHALNLYRNKGFKETGAMDEDEIELSLMLL